MNSYIVDFTKTFTSGHLKGISVDSRITFATLQAAVEYVAFCHAHKLKPVTPCVGNSKYIIGYSRISMGEWKPV